MTSGVKACKLLKGSEVCALDSKGQFGGILSIWNPKKCNLTPFKTRVNILLEGRIQGFKDVVGLLNIYALYRDIRVFWETANVNGVLNLQNLIIAGNMSFTMFSYEN